MNNLTKPPARHCLWVWLKATQGVEERMKGEQAEAERGRYTGRDNPPCKFT